MEQCAPAKNNVSSAKFLADVLCGESPMYVRWLPAYGCAILVTEPSIRTFPRKMRQIFVIGLDRWSFAVHARCSRIEPPEARTSMFEHASVCKGHVILNCDKILDEYFESFLDEFEARLEEAKLRKGENLQSFFYWGICHLKYGGGTNRGCP